MAVFNYGAPGLGHVGAYQVSGKPFVSGGIDVTAGGTRPDNSPLQINFPSVTRWVILTNHDTTNDVNVAFSANGFDTNNFFTVSSDTNDRANMMTQRMELKVSSLFISGASTQVDLIAGLTNVATSSIANNWSGSLGVG
jgi:hypothetical protein